MKNRLSKITGSSQLRWVILLLAVAVILPTVCLLWFMNQAVKNERLAVRQKLIDVYENRAITFGDQLDAVWSNDPGLLGSSVQLQPHLLFQLLAVPTSTPKYSGYLIYDSDGNLAYPILEKNSYSHQPSEQLFENAWHLEFAEDDPDEAVKLYESIAGSASSPNDYYAANMGIIRCLDKSEKTHKAIQLCHDLAYPESPDPNDTHLAAHLPRSRLMLAGLYKKIKHQNLPEELRRQLTDLLYDKDSDYALTPIPSAERTFALDKLIELTNEAGLANELADELSAATRTIEAEHLSLIATELFPTADALKSWSENTIRRLRLAETLYGVHYKIADKTILCLMSKQNLFSYIQSYANDMQDSSVVCAIYDNLGDFAAGASNIQGKPFLTSSLSKRLPMWSLQLYFRDPGVFENAASKQTALYTWGAGLVILLILVTGGVAGEVVGKQIKLNRLKNDFIATVTHELKTPLASMRVLVDTLLEGRYEGQQQVTEYLELVSKENERLSRLIDNFLTFSRMERNKRAFEMAATSPAAIAHVATEAVKTKFSKGRCKFNLTIEENLPDVLADHDAMVTVLINLLDNAYKYSYDDKRIALTVFSENGSVCFRVSDNGTGFSRRAAKKIFNRFYQVDRNLSRTAEGCGLGLSIVKFIIDAHKGQIDVDSKPGKGSRFTVKLPMQITGK